MMEVSPMKIYPFLRRSLRILFIILISMCLAAFALVLSANYQYPENPACQGMLGGGFPLLYICDNWGGGSPTSSWGKIDYIDVMNGGIIPAGLQVDFLFYTGLFFMAMLLMRVIYHRLSAARIKT